MAVQNLNGHGPAAAGSITRTPSFTPITPVVKERVGDVASRLSEVERIIEDINLQSATSTTRSPTMGDLQEEIDLLKKDVEATKAAQKKQVDGLRNNVKNEVKDQITKAVRAEIERKIKESIESQVKIVVGEWGESDATKKFVENLKGMIQENDTLHQEAQVKLDNSRARHQNSMLDEHADFETNLSMLKLPNGNISNAFPRTLRDLFSYDEKQLLQLLDDYELRQLNTHLENLNRFLAFIGLRFSVPEQSLDFLDNPPAYSSPNVLEPSKEKTLTQVSPALNQTEKKTEVIPEVPPEPKKTPQEPTSTATNSVKTQPQKQPDKKEIEYEKHGVQQDHAGQNQAGIELSALARQPPPATVNHQSQWKLPHGSNNPETARPTTPTQQLRSRPPYLQPPSPQQPNPQGGKGVGGWLRSITDLVDR